MRAGAGEVSGTQPQSDPRSRGSRGNDVVLRRETHGKKKIPHVRSGAQRRLTRNAWRYKALGAREGDRKKSGDTRRPTEGESLV